MGVHRRGRVVGEHRKDDALAVPPEETQPSLEPTWDTERAEDPLAPPIANYHWLLQLSNSSLVVRHVVCAEKLSLRLSTNCQEFEKLDVSMATNMVTIVLNGTSVTTSGRTCTMQSNQ
jgi:hypothetical protein